MSSNPLGHGGHTYQNIQIGGNARVLLGNSSGQGSEIVGRADFVGQYAHSSLRPVGNYVPRPTLEQKIREQLPTVTNADDHDSRTAVVWGLGGSGKSQLVLNYIRERRREYGAVFWIEAGQKETIERDYIQIYRLLFGELAARAESIKLGDVVPMVKTWFQRQTTQSLVVLDSADTIDDANDASYIELEYFLPDAPSVDIIITTRSSRAQEMTALEAVEVGDMEAGEAAELFRKCAKLDHFTSDISEEIHKIVKELGYLALAVTLAASYVASTPRLSLHLQQYLPEYHERRKQLLSVKAKKYAHQYGESVLSTWETSFSAVERQSPLASTMLSMLSFFNFDDIFLNLVGTNTNSMRQMISFNAYVPASPEERFEIESVLKVLQSYSLVQWRRDQGVYTMHKLVHAWGRDRLPIDQQQELSLTALEILSDIILVRRENLAFQLRLVPHVMANFEVVSTVHRSSGSFDAKLNLVDTIGDFLRDMGRYSDEYGVRQFHLEKVTKLAIPEHPLTLTSKSKLAVVLMRQSKYEQAEKMHRQVLRLREAALGKEHPSTLTSMDHLATVLVGRGKYEQAEEIDRQVLKLRERVLGKEHPDTLTSMDNLAEVLTRQQKGKLAEEMQRQVLKSRETALGKEHLSTLGSMDVLASVLGNQGKYEEAEEMHRQVLKLRETVLGENHPSTLRSMNSLAVTLGELSKYEQAEEVQRQALRLREIVHGKENHETLTSMNNLALVLGNQRKYRQAEEMHRQSLRLYETVLGKEHPSTLTSMSNLAVVLSEQGKYEQAEELTRQALKLKETVLGKEHPDTLVSMNNLAFVLVSQGKYKQAEEMHQQVLELIGIALGKEHPKTLISMGNLAGVLIDQGKNEQGEEIHRETLRLREKVLGKEHYDTLISMEHLAAVLGTQGKHTQAEELRREVLKLRETVQGKEHPTTLTSMDSLAVVLGIQGKHVQAEELYRETLKLRETVQGKEHLHTLTNMDNLAVVLGTQGKHVQAEELRREVLKLRETVQGKEHPTTLTSIDNLAIVLGAQGKHVQAEELHREVLKLRETLQGKENPTTLLSMRNLAMVLRNQGKHAQAEEMHREVLRLREMLLGKAHPNTLDSLFCLACLLQDQRRFDEATDFYERALKGYQASLGPDHPVTKNCLQRHSSCKVSAGLARMLHPPRREAVNHDRPYPSLPDDDLAHMLYTSLSREAYYIPGMHQSMH